MAPSQDKDPVSPVKERGSAAETEKRDQEQRRYERLKASLVIQYRVLDSQGGDHPPEAFVTPRSIKANTAETRDLNRLATEDDALSEDISLGGLKLDTPVPLAEGARLRLAITLPDVPIPVRAIAEVRWCANADGLWRSGLKFLGISKSDLEKVERFLVLQKRAQISRRG